MVQETVVHPFDMSRIERGADGIARYRDRPHTVIEMLRASVDRVPNGEAVVEISGARFTYERLWDRAARVAGGLHAHGVSPGDRVAIRLTNGLDWVVAFFGSLMAGAVFLIFKEW